MILESLELFNFRQFKGPHLISFATDPDTPSKNVTVIFGQNGRGKTSLFRAVLFCLFGDRQLSQDVEAAEEELHLVNKHQVHANSEDGKASEAWVQLRFSHKRQKYELRRAMKAALVRSRITEELTETRLSIRKEDGNTEVLNDPKDIANRIGSIIDARVREYFLFDGERIERLTRADAQQRREVSKGIRNLLNIDSLESAITATQNACRELDKNIRSKSTGEHAQVLKQLNDNEDKQADCKRRLDELEAELAFASEERRKVDKELLQYKEIIALLKQRSELETAQAGAKDAVDKATQQLRERIGKAGVLLIASTVKGVFEHINERKSRGEIPPEIRGDLLEKIIRDGKCICGRQIVPGSQPHELILEWKEKSGSFGVGDAALELWRNLSDICSRVSDTRDGTEAALQSAAESQHEVRRLQSKLEEVSKRIGSGVRKDAAKLEDHRKAIEDNIISLTAEKQRLRNDLDALKREAEQLRAKRKLLEQGKKLQDQLIARSELATDLRNALGAVFESFKVDIKEQLARVSTELFHRLLDAEGSRNLHKILVKDDYSLQITDRWNGQFLANISAGQRQIMSIAFIAALAQAASGSDIVEMPLFMDTPFGRLSYDHRGNLIREVPNMCAQWILLATDTELSQTEATLLLNGKRWGRFYHLKALEDGTTVVEEKGPKESVALLRRELES